ncbi:MAG: serine/threonine-protein kinase [Pirellulaceae bacterium]|nr:serine/threonine-protein kinase [Pirellulaceae bacterium]MDP7014776.1 serine/threonine-protein kinase [Pirellulaceae bacterium]
MTPNDGSDRALDELCQRILEDQWRTIGTSEFASAEEIFRRFPQLDQSPDRQVDIVYNEFLLRLEQAPDESSRPDDYLDRFPAIAAMLQDQFQLYSCLQEPGENQSDTDPLGSIADESDHPPGITLAGCTVDDRYEVVAKIGHGGAADVYRAQDLRLKREVAFKVSRQPMDAGARPFRRFMREAESAARLSHPGIVQVFEFGEYQGRPFIVGQLLRAGTMSDRIQSKGVERSSVNEWMIRLCDAVEYAHQCGVVHRDLKPANVLFGDNGQPMITDFGLASLLEKDSTLTEHGDMLGTPAYMSPEQSTGVMDVGPASDIYSLGVILYELLTGVLPYSGSATSVLSQISSQQEPTDPRVRDRTIPTDLQTICLKAMSKSAADRYQSAHTMAEDLRRFSSGEPILARPLSFSERLARRAMRSPAVSVMALLLVLVSGLSLGGSLQYFAVVKQRNRATEAEQKSMELLVQGAVDAGKLAQSQGRTLVAVERYREAIDRGISTPGPLHLRMAACEIMNGNIAAANAHVQAAQPFPTTTSQQAQVDLLKAQLALAGVSEYGEVEGLLRVIETEHLSAADRHFVAGLRAGGSLPALDRFQKAVELDSHHHGARRMASLLALSLADMDLAIELADVSLDLFPDDDDFALISALALATRGRQDDAAARIKATKLSVADQRDWTALVEFVGRLCHDLNSGGERVFYKILSADDSELSFEKLVNLLVQFRDEFVPLLRCRRWMLPPHTERAFEDFLGVAQQWQASPRAEPAKLKLMKTGIAIVEAHPEATLSTVIARRLLDLGVAETDDRLKIQFFYENAIGSKGFLRDVQQHARIGAFAVAIHLDRIDHHESEQNRRRAYELLKAIDPNTIVKLDTARILTLVPMTEKRWSDSARFVLRWVELAREQESKEKLIDALWHHALVLRSQGQWFKVLLACDEILQVAPDPATRHETVRPTALRNQAAAQLTEALDVSTEGFNWSWVFEPAVERRNWTLAEIALAQLKQSPQAPVENRTLEMYRELLDAAKDKDSERVVGVLDQLKERTGGISETLQRIRQQAADVEGAR